MVLLVLPVFTESFSENWAGMEDTGRYSGNLIDGKEGCRGLLSTKSYIQWKLGGTSELSFTVLTGISLNAAERESLKMYTILLIQNN